MDCDFILVGWKNTSLISMDSLMDINGFFSMDCGLILVGWKSASLIIMDF